MADAPSKAREQALLLRLVGDAQRAQYLKDEEENLRIRSLPDRLPPGTFLVDPPVHYALRSLKARVEAQDDEIKSLLGRVDKQGSSGKVETADSQKVKELARDNEELKRRLDADRAAELERQVGLLRRAAQDHKRILECTRMFLFFVVY